MRCSTSISRSILTRCRPIRTRHRRSGAGFYALVAAQAEEAEASVVGAAKCIMKCGGAFEGKTFTGLTRDNSTTPPTYKTTVDGVTAQMTYSLVPPEAFIKL